MTVSADWQALVLGPEFHDGGIRDIIHGMDLRTLEFTVERADSARLSREGKSPALYRFRFSRAHAFDLRLVLPGDFPVNRDPLAGVRNPLSWRWAELLSRDEIGEYRPPTSEYQGMRVYLHPWAEMAIVFHSLDIEFVGSAGTPWYQNEQGAR